MGKYDAKIYETAMNAFDDLGAYKCARGYLRYEEMRKLSPLKISELHIRNLEGEQWDDMIDELITQKLP
jgi:hypothetical protein